MWALLSGHPVFRRLWAAATVDALGTWLLVMAVPVQIYAVTGSETSTAVALAVQAAPTLVIGPWAGVLVDRWSRRSVFIAANVLAAAGVGMITTGPVELIYAGLVVESVAACFLRPALQATVPQVVPDREARAAANALLAVSHSVLRIGAPLAGTALTAAGWFTVVVAVDAASYLIAALMLTSLPRSATERGRQATQRRQPARTAIKQQRQTLETANRDAQTRDTNDRDAQTHNTTDRQRPTRTATGRERTTHLLHEGAPPTHSTTNRDLLTNNKTDQKRETRTATTRQRTTHPMHEGAPPTHKTSDWDLHTRDATEQHPPTRHADEGESPARETANRDAQTRNATDRARPMRDGIDRSAALRHGDEGEPPTRETGRSRAAAEVWDGWLIVVGSRLLGGMLAGSFIFWAANAALTAMLVPFVAHRLHGDGVVVGQLAMGLGAGYLGGSVLSRALLVRWTARIVLAGSYGAVGVCFLVLFGTTSIPVAVIAITAAGVPGAVAAVATSHHLQSATPDDARGRVAATFQTSDAAAAVVGALAGAALGRVAGAPLVLSALVLVASVLTAVLLRSVGSAGGRAQDRRTRGAVV